MRQINGLAGCQKAEDATATTYAVRITDGSTSRVVLSVGINSVSLDLEEALYISDRLVACVERLRVERAT